MQPQSGAPAATPARTDRLLNWLAGLFPVIAVAGVIVQYGYIWSSESGPSNIGIALVIPVVLIVVVALLAMQWAQKAWKHRAVLLYGIPIALVFTAAVFYAAHYNLDYRFQASERSRAVDEIETKVKGIVNNELTARNGQLPMQGDYIDLSAMGYSNCSDVAPAAQQQPCPYKFKLVKVGNDLQAQMVDKAPWVNPFDQYAGLADLLFWLAVFAGSFIAFEQYVSALPGPRPS